jgi:hypothetical protein
MTDKGTSSTTDSNSSGDIFGDFQKIREGKELIAWIQNNYEKSKNDRMKFERQWALNMAFFQGNQNLQYMPRQAGAAVAGKLFTPPAPSWAIRTITNRIRPIIRTELARLTSNKPSASVVPASSEDADLFAAQAAEQIWESLYNGKKIHDKFIQAAFWMCICGTSFIKDWWDPNAYDNVTKADGSIMYGVVTPYHIFVPDIMTTDIEEQPWVINAYTKSVEFVKNTFDRDVVATVNEAKSPFDTAMLQTMGGKNEAKPDSVLLIEMWIKPGTHKMFPNGGLVTIASDQILQLEEAWPFDHKE